MYLGFLVADIVGPDLLIVLAIVALLFGGSQLPKLARSLGSASHEFKKGIEEGSTANGGPVAGGGAAGTGQRSEAASKDQPQA
ncbi:MAG: twin-arginine translocase TatA/TatE family subunit [Acidimicrobiales bacterium]